MKPSSPLGPRFLWRTGGLGAAVDACQRRFLGSAVGLDAWPPPPWLPNRNSWMSFGSFSSLSVGSWGASCGDDRLRQVRGHHHQQLGLVALVADRAEQRAQDRQVAEERDALDRATARGPTASPAIAKLWPSVSRTVVSLCREVRPGIEKPPTVTERGGIDVADLGRAA